MYNAEVLGQCITRVAVGHHLYITRHYKVKEFFSECTFKSEYDEHS